MKFSEFISETKLYIARGPVGLYRCITWFNFNLKMKEGCVPRGSQTYSA